MKRVRFSTDEGSVFYQELLEAVDQYFASRKITKSGNSKMYFKIGMYFSLNIIFYVLM